MFLYPLFFYCFLMSLRMCFTNTIIPNLELYCSCYLTFVSSSSVHVFDKFDFHSNLLLAATWDSLLLTSGVCFIAACRDDR